MTGKPCLRKVGQSMIENPFSPMFGGRPGMFFGREEILAKFMTALNSGGSHYRTLFITGGRSVGKTTLLERLSQIADQEGLVTVDAVYSNAIEKLVKAVSGYDEVSVTKNPELSVNVMGSGLGAKAGSVSKMRRYGPADLDDLIRRKCAEHSKGLLLTVDGSRRCRTRTSS